MAGQATWRYRQNYEACNRLGIVLNRCYPTIRLSVLVPTLQKKHSIYARASISSTLLLVIAVFFRTRWAIPYADTDPIGRLDGPGTNPRLWRSSRHGKASIECMGTRIPLPKVNLLPRWRPLYRTACTYDVGDEGTLQVLHRVASAVSPRDALGLA